MKYIKKYHNYVFLFLFFFFVLLVFSFYNHSYDSFWNYSFSYAIARGEVPYLDFNTVSTPFCAFFFSIFLIFSNNYLWYVFGWSLVLTFTFYLLFQLIQQRSFIVLFALLFPFLHTIIPTYNLFCFCLFVLLVYLEKNHKSDYLIGFVLGLSVLTKQTIGIFFLLASIVYCFKDFKKLGRRFIGFVIPCLVFLTYLLVTHSFMAFLDLCFFGLFDFSKNSSGKTIHFYLSIIAFILLFFYVFKKDRKIEAYYTLATFSFVVPLFDSYHFLLFLCSLLVYIMTKVNVSKGVCYLFLILSIFLCFINFYSYRGFSSKRLDFLPNLEYYLVQPNQYEILSEMNQVFLKYYEKDRVPVLLSTKNSFIYTGNDLDVNYFLVFLHGNYGYNGSSKVIDRVKESDDLYIINQQEMKEIGEDGDFLYEVCDYIMKHFSLVAREGDYLIYEK